MTFYLPASDDTAAATRLAVAGAPGDLDLGEGGGAPVDAPAPVQPEAGDFYDGRPSIVDRFAAQAIVTRIRKDYNGRSGKIERDYIDELIEAVPPQYITDDRGDPRTTPEERRHDWLLEAMRRAAEADPEQYGHLPTSIEDIDAALDERRRAELDDAQAVLDAADGWIPELLGDLWAEASTPQGAMMLLTGAGGGARLLPTVLIEGGAAALDETRTLGDQYDVADDLDLPEPRPGLQIGTAFAVGAGLGGVMYGVAKGAERFLGYGRASDDIEAEQRPDEVSPVQHRRQMDQALDALARGDQAPAVDDGPFDWTPHLTGNAAIREDTVSGMTPQFRSGLEAMIQSSPTRIRSGLQVYSGYRSPEVQAGIIADNMPKYGLTDRVGAWRADVAAMGPEAAGRKWRPLFRSKGLTRMVGMPGGSNHQKGSAADLKWNGIRLDRAPSDVRDWVHANAPQFGLHFPMGHEPWHIEPSGARSGTPARKRDAAEGQPLSFGDFDFGPKGNASPTQNRVGYVYGRLLSKGYTPAQAAGLLGNLIQESGPGLNVGAIGDSGAAIGMGQWNGPRAEALKAFARARGKDWQDLDTQIDFLDHELRTSEKAAGDAIRASDDAADVARIASNQFWRPGVPMLANRIGYAKALAKQHGEGYVPRFPGARSGSAPTGGATSFSGYTSRGYTGTGQVTAGDGQTVQVEYEVVDLSELTRASGDLQPRDRSRAASDEQVAEIAARLDPARLMPSPEADRGAPIVGPDGMIESGNGRTMAIERAYERHADRAAAYRQQIETAGFPIPEGVERPVLIGRRTSELSEAERQAFVRGANQSQIARMSSTERAAVDARAIDAETVGSFTPGFGLNAPENAAFTRAVLAKIPQAERAGLVDANGRINAEGQLRIKQALFARAYDAPDLLARYTETDAGALKSLMEALELAAPEWAAMRAAVADGRLRPEMDITPFVLDAMRLIALARETAAREGGRTAQILDGMLAEIDLLEGAVPPLTVALVRKFMPGGKAARAETIGNFLTRYATEAQKIGSTEASLFEAPGPLDALKAIDRDGFGELTETGRASTPPTRPEPDAKAAAPTPIPPSDPLPTTPRAPAAEDTVQELAEAEALTSLRAEAGAEIEMPDGTTWTVGEVLDDLDADEALATVVDLCGLKGTS